MNAVHMERGTGGGCFLPSDYRDGFTKLTEPEIQALFLSSSRLPNDLGLKQASDSAMLKLLAALPLALRHEVRHMVDRIYIDNSTWKRRVEEGVPLLKEIQEAVFTSSRIRFMYKKEEGLSQRTAGPLGLVFKGSTWYMVAENDGEIRSYRVSRIMQVALLQERTTTPDDFNLQEYWNHSVASFPERLPRYPVVLMCHMDSVELLRRNESWLHSEVR